MHWLSNILPSALKLSKSTNVGYADIECKSVVPIDNQPQHHVHFDHVTVKVSILKIAIALQFSAVVDAAAAVLAIANSSTVSNITAIAAWCCFQNHHRRRLIVGSFLVCCCWCFFCCRLPTTCHPNWCYLLLKMQLSLCACIALLPSAKIAACPALHVEKFTGYLFDHFSNMSSLSLLCHWLLGSIVHYLFIELVTMPTGSTRYYRLYPWPVVQVFGTYQLGMVRSTNRGIGKAYTFLST